MTLPTIIAYFSSIASTRDEVSTVENIFSKDTLTLEEITFLTRLQQKAVAELDEDTKHIKEAKQYLAFDEKDLQDTLLQEEEMDYTLTPALFQEAFEKRAETHTRVEKSAIEQIKSGLLQKKLS